MKPKLEIIKAQLLESASVKKIMAEQLSEQIAGIAEILINALRNDKKIMWCGNGGSAADCQHLSAELVSRLRFSRPSIPSVSLTTDTSLLTAHANDCGFGAVFSRQIEALGRAGDVLIAISTSGNSDNIINAVNSAKNLNIYSVAFSGKDGGKIKNLADNSIIVPSDDVQRIQEGHITIGHIICDLLEQNLFGGEEYRSI